MSWRCVCSKLSGFVGCVLGVVGEWEVLEIEEEFVRVSIKGGEFELRF